MLSNDEISDLIKLVNFAIEKRPDYTNFRSISDKLSSLTSELVPKITEYNTELLDKCLDNLKSLTDTYSGIDGGGDTGILESIKKRMSGELQFLATHKDKLIDKASHYEDILKDDLKVQLIYLIMKEQGISLNQSEKVVKGDIRYIEYRDQVYELRKYANKLKSLYDVYSKIWQGIIQSISTSRKEEKQVNYNG